MSKTYICALGAGNYQVSKYSHEELAEPQETRYAQIATMKLWHCEEWTKTDGDKIILLVTDKAKKNCLDDHKDREGNEVLGLYNEMLGHGINKDIIDVVPIKDGSNNEEIMEIFLQINEHLPSCPITELYFDVTYGLRYLPMLTIVFNNYSRFVNKTICKHIAYGSFETQKDGKTPIIELDWLDEIQQWTTAAENFITSGNSNNLKKLVDAENKKAVGGKKSKNDAMSSSLNALTNTFQTCTGRYLIEGNVISDLFDNIEKTNTKDLPEPMHPLMDLIKSEFGIFSKEGDWKNVLKASKWCFDHQLYQQSLTFLQESLFTYACIIFSLDWGMIKDRDLMSAVVHFLYPGKPKKNVLPRKEFVTSQMQYFIDSVKSSEILTAVFEILNKCTALRNQYNHAGMLKDLTKPEKMIGKIGALIKSAIDIDYEAQTPMKGQEDNKPVCFVNVSNHPSSRWGEAQLNAAQQFGEVIDIPFPNVEEDCDTEDIKRLSDDMVEKILNATSNNSDSIIHIMGEMNLTYSTVKILRRLGYTCFASTTKRTVVENPDGTKTSQFSFVKFREYE